MIKQTASLIILLFLLTTQLFAQQYFHWTKKAGGASNDYVNSIVCPANNKIYAAGGFVGSITTGNEKAEGFGKRDIFLACYNNNGKAEWIKALGGIEVDNVTRLATGEKCIYMAGVLSGNASLGKNNFSGNSQSLFVASWSLKGKINWLTRFNYKGVITSDVLKVSPDGKIIAGGMFQGELEVNGKKLTRLGKKRAYAITISSEGKPEKTTISSGSGEHRFVSAAFNNENESYYLFSTTGSLYFGNHSNVFSETEGKKGLVLLKNNSTGKPEWSQFIEAVDYSEAVRVASSGEGAFLCANFRNQLSTKDTTLFTNSRQAVALLKFTEKGKVCWGEVIQGPSHCRAMDAMCNKAGNLLVTGYYRDGYKVQQTEIFSENPEGSIFLLQFNGNGKVNWHNEPGDNAPNFSKSFTISQTGDILLAGGFKGELELEGEKLKSLGSTDILIAKYFNCQQLKTEIADPGPVCEGSVKELSASGAFTSFCWNGTDWGEAFEISGPGTYFVSAYDDKGCAATDTIVISPVAESDLGLPQQETVKPGEELILEANAGYLSYRWSDGEQGYKKTVRYEPAADSLGFVLTAETEEGCAVQDSVMIYFLKNEKSTEINHVQALKIYPNPVEDFVKWELNIGQPDKAKITLTNGKGEMVFYKELDNCLPHTTGQIDMRSMAAGQYLFTVLFNDVTLSEKVVKR